MEAIDFLEPPFFMANSLFGAHLALHYFVKWNFVLRILHFSKSVIILGDCLGRSPINLTQLRSVVLDKGIGN